MEQFKENQFIEITLKYLVFVKEKGRLNMTVSFSYSG